MKAIHNIGLTIEANSNAGTDPELIIKGDNTAGIIQVTPGSDPSGNAICNVLFLNSTYANTSDIAVLLTPLNSEAARINCYATSRSDVGFSIESAASPEGKCLWAYSVIEVLAS